jgi:hypothetical protein
MNKNNKEKTFLWEIISYTFLAIFLVYPLTLLLAYGLSKIPLNQKDFGALIISISFISGMFLHKWGSDIDNQLNLDSKNSLKGIDTTGG